VNAPITLAIVPTLTQQRMDDEMLLTWAVLHYAQAETPEGRAAAWKAMQRVIAPLLDTAYGTYASTAWGAK